MKRIIYIALAALFVSCAKDTTERVNMHSGEWVGIAPATTRAAASTLAGLQGGFSVVATHETGNGTMIHPQMAGNNIHKYVDGEWGFVNPVEWPAAAAEYPLNFAAFYPNNDGDVDGVYFSNGSCSQDYETLLFSVKALPLDAADHKDLIVATATVHEKPAAGKLDMTFRHAMSKVGFATEIPTGYSVDVRSVGMGRVNRAGRYVLGVGSGAPLAPNGWMSGILLDLTGEFTMTDPADNFFMIPQAITSWDAADGVPTAGSTGAYITLVYRMTGLNPWDEVGLSDASTHPDNDGGVSGPLYVKAGFPVGADHRWEEGHAYLYNITLGEFTSSDGYIFDENYYDAAGNRTSLKLLDIRNGEKSLGDPLRDGEIHITVDVDRGWGD